MGQIEQISANVEQLLVLVKPMQQEIISLREQIAFLKEERLLSVKEAAKRLDTTETTIRKMISAGVLKSKTVNNLTKLPISVIDDYIRGSDKKSKKTIK